MDLELADKVVLVTGSSKGIGRATAETFLREGARVVITGRDRSTVEDAVTSFAAFGDRVRSFCGDLNSGNGISSVVQETLAHWQRIDVLVSNVGSGTGRGGWELAENDWSGAFETNFRGAARAAQAVLPTMIQSKSGCITFIGSIVGVESVGAPLPYSAAKAALHNYAANLARQVGHDGVRVNCIAPGNVLFPGGTWEQKLSERREFFEEYIRREASLERFGSPQEIADAAVFVSSARASFITGAIIVADGGQTRSY
ncbi:MAG TPA: SDR family oxidoreductase [Abditibacteriaceae bacterium]|jgi:3-oxoacyl-[acyl-carrier protein] reductase